MRPNRTATQASRRAVPVVFYLLFGSLALLLLLATPALAVTVTDRPLLFSFDGSGSTAGAFRHPSALAVDNSNGDVYVYAQSGSKGVVDRFNAGGEAQDFTAGESSLTGTPEGAFREPRFEDDLAVDNSGDLGGPGEGEQGRLYVGEDGGATQAFDAEGNYLWTLPRTTVAPCGIDVDGAGHLWVIDEAKKKALEFANAGSPPAQIGEVSLTASSVPCRIGVDQGGTALSVSEHPNRFGSTGKVQKYTSGIFDSTLTPRFTRDLAVDHSKVGGHVFTLRGTKSCAAPSPPALSCSSFSEFDSSGAEIGSFGDDLLEGSNGIAYNPSLDRVYVSVGSGGPGTTENRVRVFGPKATATAPNVSSAETDEIEATEATAHGAINPQGVPDSYHFEWAAGGNEVQHLRVQGNAGTFRLWTGGDECCREYTEPEALPFDISPLALREAIETLGPIGPGNVTVTGTPADPETNAPGDYEIAFGGELEGANVDQLLAQSIDLDGTSPLAQFSTKSNGPNWANAESSPLPYPGIEPTDSSSHPVSAGLSGLKSNTTYSVRLVGTNTTNHLSSYSKPDIFKTAAGPPPVIETCSVSAIATKSAHLSCDINPQSPGAGSWHVQMSTDPLCATGFSDGPDHTLPAGEALVVVETDLEGLLPAQHYCVRVLATNGFGSSATSETKEFTTSAIPPSEASIAFAAPRTDTEARLNARVNPEGAPLTYRFEYSKDGGATWIPLADKEDASGERKQIVLGEELSNLNPHTTYSYRFSAENAAGPAAPPSGAASFTTRTTAEVTLPKRGTELVNNPDKGNQNVTVPVLTLGSVIAANGEEALWSVIGGAPGGNNGTQSIFLAERTASGWQSRSLAPPAAQQIGGGKLIYGIEAATPDFSRFLFGARHPTALSSPYDLTRVLLDAHQNQTLLKEYAFEGSAGRPGTADMTSDGAHVLAIDHQGGQLEEIGAGGSEVLSLMPGNTESSCGLDSEGSKSFVGGTGPLPSGTGILWRNGYHMIASTDASVVYFGAKPNGECGKPYGLYVRDRNTEETRLIDPGTEDKEVAFIRATPDGREAFFATYSQLDPADTNEDVDIYRWNGETGESSCLSCVVADAKIEDVNGGYTPILVSDDFSHIYFDSSKQLIAGEGIAGQRNLYVLSGGTIRFVAVRHITESTDRGFLSQAELSSDGNTLVFKALPAANLTADAVQCGSGCEELYRYDDRDGSLECISCVHGGTTAHGITGGGIGGTEFQMSADGSTVAFLTDQALVPQDVNRGNDIYEWRNGARRLITDGVTEFNSGLAGPLVRAVDTHGDNIFFSVADPGLTGFEQDGLANLYDARTGGGFEPPSPPVHCDGDSCQGPLAPPPAAVAPASSIFSGAGNQTGGSKPKPRRPCAKKRGKARRRCMRKHKKRHSQMARANNNAGRAK